jgi:hypothetical protein
LHRSRKYKYKLSGSLFELYFEKEELGSRDQMRRDGMGRDGTSRLGTRDGMGLSKKTEAGWDGTG